MMKTNTNKIIAYYRVSTKKQSLGIDAQREMVKMYAVTNGLEIVKEISEKESGKEDDRPGINLAIATARKYRCPLVAAKVDRISRDISYAAWVFFKAGIDVVALNLPENVNDPLVFSVYFGMAQQELKYISERTKAAMSVKNAEYERKTWEFLHNAGYRDEDVTPELFEQTRRDNGWKFGRPGWDIKESETKAAAVARKKNADEKPANIAAAQELRRYFEQTPGKRNLSAAARHLNDMQLYTSRGVFHTAMSVKLLIKRYDI